MKNMLDEAWGVCYYNTRFVGQAVKTPPSHGGNTGSIPVRTAELSIQCLYRFLRNCCRHWIFVFLYGHRRNRNVGLKCRNKITYEIKGIKVMHLVKLEEIPGAKEELKKIRKRFYDWMKDPSAFSE